MVEEGIILLNELIIHITGQQETTLHLRYHRPQTQSKGLPKVDRISDRLVPYLSYL